MIIGGCPYCDAPLMISIADNCPCFEKHDCEECKQTIWTYHSRLNPESYTEDGFKEEWSVDEETKVITPLNRG